MAESVFRKRGVRVLVDTVAAAEYDIALHQVPAETLTTIARNLQDLPYAATDRAVGNFLIREVSGFDIVYIVGREGADVIVTIGRIRLPDPKNPTEAVLQNLNLVAIFRGAAGL